MFLWFTGSYDPADPFRSFKTESQDKLFSEQESERAKIRFSLIHVRVFLLGEPFCKGLLYIYRSRCFKSTPRGCQRTAPVNAF